VSPTEFDTLERLETICEECRQILQNNPRNVQALRRLGYAQWIIGDYLGVEMTATQILGLNPADADWLYSRAMARLAMSRPEDAEADLLCARGITTDHRMIAVLDEALNSVENMRANGDAVRAA
jgi:hypothetical protein